jgi:hypothetical protein
VVDRDDLERIARAVKGCGFEYRHAGDMVLDTKAPKARNAVHLVFAGEKVRPD